MRINVQKVIEMWDKKNFTSEERKKDFKSIINYYDNIINYEDLGFLTINIHVVMTNEYKDINIQCLKYL